MRDRDAAGRRYGGRGRDCAPAPGSCILLQARRRRAVCQTVARRAADAGSDAASVRRSRDCDGRFHRERRSSDDQSDLARPPCDRRRGDSAAAKRSHGAADPCGDGAAPVDPRTGAPRRSFRAQTPGDIVMNEVTAIAPVITAGNAALRRDFPLKPFAIRHKLAGHPLLTLPRIAQLAAELPRDLIEYNSGKVAISQDPDAIPHLDLDPVEVVKSIETSGAWTVLKRVENSPQYRRLLEDTLLFGGPRARLQQPARRRLRAGRGFLVRVLAEFDHAVPSRQRRLFLRAHPRRKVLHDLRQPRPRHRPDDEIERSMTRHRYLKYDERFASRGIEFHLFAGDGCFVPYQWPHCMRTADSYSISMAITWKTREVRRRNDLHFFNSMLRGLGLPQQPPGTQPVRDALKLAFYRSVTTAIRPLRASLKMRRRAASHRARQTRELLSERG